MAGYYGYGSAGYSPSYDVEPSYENWVCGPDHVCRPAAVDTDVRRRPVVAGKTDRDPEGYVVQTETYIERVQPPLIREYRYGIPGADQNRKSYGIVGDQPRKPLSQIQDCPPMVEEFFDRIQSEVSSPRFQFAPPAPIRTETWRHDPSPGSPKVSQIEVRQPASRYPVPLRTETWRQDSNVGSPKANQAEVRPLQPTRFPLVPPRTESRRQDFNHITNNPPYPYALTRQDSSTFAPERHLKPRPVPDSRLSKPTNNIDSAMEYLKEAARALNGSNAPPASAPSPAPLTAPPRHNFPAEIDNKEAEKLYGHKPSPRPAVTTEEKHTDVIDSREAARRYSGALV